MSLKRAGRSKYKLTDGEGQPLPDDHRPATNNTSQSEILESVFQQQDQQPGANPSEVAQQLGGRLVSGGNGGGRRGNQQHQHQQQTSLEGAGEPISLESLKGSGLLTTIIPNRLHFASFGGHPRSTNDVLYFTTDFHLMYTPYFADFGPLNMSCAIRFYHLLKKRLDDPQWKQQQIVYYSGHGAHQRSNAACLMASFCVLHLNLTAAETYALFEPAYPPLLPFRDASYGISTFNLTLLDLMQGLYKAKTLGWIDAATFDVDTYDMYDALENGDWNWIVPKQIIAFSSPVDGVDFRGVQHVAQAFRHEKVRAVIRLNEILYDKRGFTSLGIEHHEIQYPDGSCPTDSILQQTLHAMERSILKEGGAVAIHCKAGLGRTGTMIAVYLMKHYGFTAREAIGWCRLCRPGSVIGPQQAFLEQIEHRFRRSSLLKQAIGTSQLALMSSTSSHSITKAAVGVSVTTPLPHKTMFTVPHKGGPTGCMKKAIMPNPTLHPTQARLPGTTSAGEQHHSALEATAQLYDHTYPVQQQTLTTFKYDSSRTDALKTAKSSTRRAMYILENAKNRRVHGEITGRNTTTDSRSSSSLGMSSSSKIGDPLGGGHNYYEGGGGRSSSQLRSSSQMSSYLESTSADITAAVSNTFIDSTLRKLNVTTSSVEDVLPELVAKPAACENSKGPGWLRPTQRVPRASSSMW